MYETRSGVAQKVKDLFPSWSLMFRKSTRTCTRWKQVGSRSQLIQQLITAARETDKIQIQFFCLKATNSLKQTHEMFRQLLLDLFTSVSALRNGLYVHKINCIRLSEDINLWIVKRKHSRGTTCWVGGSQFSLRGVAQGLLLVHCTVASRDVSQGLTKLLPKRIGCKA